MTETVPNPFASTDSAQAGPDPFGQLINNYDRQNTNDTANDPFGEMIDNYDKTHPQEPTSSSAFGAAARGAVRGTLPAVGGIAAAARGARLGMMAGALIPGLGETGIGEAAGAIGGGLIGGFGGSALVDKAQDYLVSKLPDSWKDPIEEQQKADIEKHPYASFAGGLVPFAVTMSPGAWTKAANLPPNATMFERYPALAHVFGGAVQGGIELGQEAVNGDYDWRKLAISSGFGLVFNTPNRIGRYIEGHSGPTIAQAHDTKVAGESVPESVFLGTEDQDPHAAMAAQQAARDEDALIGRTEPPKRNVHDVARQMEPDLFAKWDALKTQRDAFKDGTDATTQAHLKATEDELNRLAPDIAAVYRSAADPVGAETVEPVGPGQETVATPSQAATEPAKPIAEQKAFIADDVARQMIAAGRPREEAEAAGQMTAWRYATLSEQFGGKEGSAEDLYRREGAKIVGPRGKKAPPAPSEAAPAAETPALAPTERAAETPATEAPDVQTRAPSAIWQDFIDKRQARSPAGIETGYNSETTKIGTPAHARRTQAWEAGNVVDVGFAKDLLIVGKNEDGTFTLVSKPDESGQSKRYVSEPHKGLSKDGTTDFLEAVKPIVGDAQNQKELFQTRDQTETPAFKQWFGASKVVDESGKPLVVYHGGPGSNPYLGGGKGAIEEFRPNSDGLIFATDKPELAGDYATARYPSRAASYPVFMSMENPLAIDRATDLASHKTLIERARAEDRDGIILKNADDNVTGKPDRGTSTVYIAFKSEQIKSALGNIGTFDPNDPRIVYQQKQGWYDPVKKLIGMTKRADGSTWVHEAHHVFLHELAKYAAHPLAPEQLRQDFATTLKWLGLKSADELFETKPNGAWTKRSRAAQEKFADGGIQYARLGVAPSKELAGVFARFRAWLTSLYETIKKLGEPINEDIKGVYDRLYSVKPERTVIAPDIERGKTLAGLHEEEAATTPPAQAEPAMARVENEAERHEAELHPEVQNELAPAVAKIEAEGAEQPTAAADAERTDGAGAAEAGHLGEGGGGPGPVAGPGERGEGPGAKLGGGGGAGTESGGVSGSEQRSVPGQGSGNGKAAPGNGVPFPRPTDKFDTDRPMAGNLRLDNIDVPEKVWPYIQKVAAENNDFIGDRRGKLTDGMRDDLARDLGMEGALDLLSKRKLGEAFNAEQCWAARTVLRWSATDVFEKMKAAANGTDEDVIEYAKAKDRHQMIQAQVAGITAEAGRALRAFHDMAGSDLAKNVNDFIKQATGKTLFQMKQEAKLGSMLDSPQSVSKFMHDADKRNFSSLVLEYWINGLISGPATHTTYMIGNLLLSSMKAGPETLIAAGIGSARRAMGREGEIVHAGESLAQFRAAGKALPGALKAAVESLKTGMTAALPGEKAFGKDVLPFAGEDASMFSNQAPKFNPEATYHDVAEAVMSIHRGIWDGLRAGSSLLQAGGVEGSPMWGLQYSLNGATPNVVTRVGTIPIGTLVRLPSRFVASIHTLFRCTNYSMQIAARAYRQAVEENPSLTGMDLAQKVAERYTNPTQEMMEDAHKESNELTLMSKGGKFTNALSQLTNTKVLGFPLLKFVDPFVKISSNIFDQSLIKRTPLGWLSPELRKELLGESGTIAQDRAQARMLAGTALCVGFGTLAAQGLVTGAGPKDPKKAAVWRTVYQPHSVRIGDTWIDLHRLGPLGMLMGMSADLYDVIHKADEGKGEEAAAHLLHAVTQNILDESFMRGPAELIQAIEDPDRHGQSYIQNFASSFVPYSVGMSQIARATDPYARQAQSTIEALRRKIPGMSEDLMPRRDIWGEPTPSADALIAPGVTALYTQKVGADPVNLAMLRLGIPAAQVGHHIRNVEITPQERDDFIRVAGRTAKMNLDRIVKSQMFDTWPAPVQRAAIMHTVKMSREAAMGWMFAHYPHILRDAAQNRLKQIHGDNIEEIE